MDLEQLFAEISNEMRSDFAKAREALDHAGLKGESSEETVRKFLKQYLPKSLDITTGTLVDSQGSVSKQLDIIISDVFKTPIFFQSGQIRVIPTECAYAIMEVKSYLNKKELENAFQNMLSVKSQAKVAYFKPKGHVVHTKNLYSKSWDYWPTNYFIFAYESDDLNTISGHLNDMHVGQQIHERIDTICVLNKGVIFNQDQDRMFSALPSDKSNIVFYETDKALLLFYTLISSILNQASMNNFSPVYYVQKIKSFQ